MAGAVAGRAARDAGRASSRLPYLLLLAIGVALAVLLAWEALPPAEQQPRSPLVGRALPTMVLPPIVAGKRGFSGGGTGRVRLVNVFASWCLPCAAEAPQLMRLTTLGLPIDGIAVRDTPAAVALFLRRRGDPFRAIGDDRGGAAQRSLGSSGLPESYLVDGQGRVLLHHPGDIRADEVASIADAAGAGR